MCSGVGSLDGRLPGFSFSSWSVVEIDKQIHPQSSSIVSLVQLLSELILLSFPKATLHFILDHVNYFSVVAVHELCTRVGASL